MDIALAFDQNYFTFFCASLESILQNHPSSTAINFHIISPDLSISRKKELKQYETAFVKFNYYKISESLIKDFVTLNSWSIAVYYRLFFPLLVNPSVKKLLYIDTDTLVLQPLTNLFSEDLSLHPVGAVYDNYVQEQSLINIPKGDYFNSGVMLIDVEKWNTQKISEQAFTFLNDYPDKIRFVDQCALNYVLKNNWERLPIAYNLMYSYIPESISNTELQGFMKDKIIVHFTLQRPWQMLCKNRLRNLYWKYLKQSKITDLQTHYSDFSMYKIPPFIKIRTIEWYLNSLLLKVIFRKLKKLLLNG